MTMGVRRRSWRWSDPVELDLISVATGAGAAVVSALALKTLVALIPASARQAWTTAGVSTVCGIISTVIGGLVLAAMSPKAKPEPKPEPTSTSPAPRPPPRPTEPNERKWIVRVSGVGEATKPIRDIGKDPTWTDVKICVYRVGTRTGGCVALEAAVHGQRGVVIKELPALTETELTSTGVAIQATGMQDGVTYTLVDSVSRLQISSNTVRTGFWLPGNARYFVSVFLQES